MKKKTIGTICMVLMMALSFSTVAYAKTTVNPYSLPFDVETGVMFDKHETALINSGLARMVIGFGELYHSKPLLSKPQAYAYTEAYATSYKVRAKCDVNSNGLGTDTTGWKELRDTKACNSGTVKATTDKAIFDGFHEIYSTSTSAAGTAQTTYSYT